MSDQPARERIRSELDTTFLVEASAGTGKTTELVQRIVAVLARGAEVSRIAAVTFTDKAAGELKLRVRGGIEAVRKRSSGAELLSLERALSRLEEARVSTIHTFAADMLRERSVEAGVDPGFVAENEGTANAVFDEAFEEWFERATSSPKETLLRVLARRVRTSHSEELRRAARKIKALSHLSAPWTERPWNRSLALAHLREELSRLLEESARPKNNQDKLFLALEPLRVLMDTASTVSLSDDDLEARLAALSQNDAFIRPHRGGPAAYNANKSRAELLQLHAGVSEELLRFAVDSAADLAVKLKVELEQVLLRYQAKKHARGVLDFDDLLLRTERLLSASEEARMALGSRLSHLFVDEFQDTDPIQSSILLHLVSADPTVSDAFQTSIVPGKLFLVGDPKQSIYRFRNADLGVYQRVRQRVVETGGEVLSLTRSFRSVPSVQRLVNAAFEPWMNGDERTLTPKYAPLEPVRAVEKVIPALIALPVPAPYGKSRLAKRSLEQSWPDAAAAFVEWLISKSGFTTTEQGKQVPLQARHICFLFRQMDSAFSNPVEPFTSALSAREITHVLVGGRSFYDREEIEAVRTACEAIERPDDTLHVVGTLRGLLFGLADEAIFEFKLRYGHLNPLRAPITALPSSVEDVGDALQLIAKLHRRRNRRRAGETLWELLEMTRAHVSFSLLPNGEQALANLLRLVQTDDDGALSFRGFVDLLRERSEEKSTGEAPILEEESDGVRMMTVHRAKGLEFPVVILADPTAKLGRAPDRHVDPEKNLGAARIFDCSPPDLLDHLDLETERERSEGVRIGYVAATRARDLLVIPIVGDDPSFPEDGWLAPLHQLLARELGPNPEHVGVAADFGSDSVRERPNDDPPPRRMIPPGIHYTSFGEVIVWDPRRLELARRPPARVRSSDLISNKFVPEELASDLRQLRSFEALRSDRLALLGFESEKPITATKLSHDAPTAPTSKVVVENVTLERAEGRARGPRFGDLVHKVLAAIEVSASDQDIEDMAKAIGRVLSASDMEVADAAVAASAATRSTIWTRCREAEERGELRREVPVGLVRGEYVVDGVVDLAFREDGAWVVVDFKTDRPEVGSPALLAYAAQVALYAEAITLATGDPSSGMLLFV